MEVQGGYEKMRDLTVRRAFNRMGLSLIVFLIVQMLAAYVLQRIFAAVSESFVRHPSFLWVMSFLAMLISMLALWLCVRGMPDAQVPEQKYKTITAKQFLLIAVAGFGLMYSAEYFTGVVTLFLDRFTGNTVNDLVSDILGEVDIYSVLYVGVIGPILEEVVFRWIPYKKLTRFGGRAYIFYTALMFGLFHMTVQQVLYAFLLGMVLAALVHYTGKLWHSILLHIVINMIGGVIPSLLPANKTTRYILYAFSVILIVAGLTVFLLWYKKQKKFSKMFFFTEDAVTDADGGTAQSPPAYLSAEELEKGFFLDFTPCLDDITVLKMRQTLQNAGSIVFMAITIFILLVAAFF